MPSPASGTLTEILAEAGETVTVGQVIGRMTAGAGAPKAAAKPAPEPTSAPRPAGDASVAVPDGAKVTPVAARVAAATGVDLNAVKGTGPAGRISKADVLAASENGASAAPAGEARRLGEAAQGRRRDARALHGRVALDPDRDLVPHDRRHHARRPPQAAQGVRQEGLLHAPDRLRDRARGDGADAGHDQRLRGDRRQAARHRHRPGQPRHRRRRREEGRRPHPDGARHPRRRPPDLPAVPRRLQRPDRPRPREQAHRGRPPGRQRLAHQPRRHRHGRLRAAADERPGHDRRHGLDRLPGRPRGDRRRDRRREGDDDDLDVRPPGHPGRRVGPVPAGRRGLPPGRARLLRAALRAARRDARPRTRGAAALRCRGRAGGAGARRRARAAQVRSSAGSPTRRCCRPCRPRSRC